MYQQNERPVPFKLTASSVTDQRSLAVVDIENLLADTNPSTELIRLVEREFLLAAHLSSNSQKIVACSHHVAEKVVGAWQTTCKFEWRSGQNGADDALIEYVNGLHNLKDFGPIVIASGDHAFTDLAIELRDQGHFVHVIAREECLAKSLRNAASLVTFLPINTAEFALAA